MRRLNKYKLNFELSLDFVGKNFNKVNELSSQVLEMLSSNTGKFYVLLPKDSDSKRIHEFNSGYITSSIDKEICHYVVGIIKNKQCSCIFDDVNVNASDNFEDEFYSDHSLFYNDEVYYAIKRKMLSEDIFFKCMVASDGIWHSLCIATIIDLDEMIGKKLNQDIIRKICINAQLVMIGAYDGEGYIFWERIK